MEKMINCVYLLRIKNNLGDISYFCRLLTINFPYPCFELRGKCSYRREISSEFREVVETHSGFDFIYFIEDEI